MKKAVCVILRNSKNEILAVSRKDNHQLFGLVGGKVDDGETIEEAIVRECFEETGYKIFNLKLIDTRVYGICEKTTYEQNCFVADYEGKLLTQEELNLKGETGIVKWIDKKVLETGFFGEYNKDRFEQIGL